MEKSEKKQDETNEKKKSAKIAAVFLGTAVIYPVLYIALTVAKARAYKKFK